MDDSSLTDRDSVVRVPAGHDELGDAVENAVGEGDPAVARVGPTGVASLAPLVTATVDGQTAVYPNCSAATAGDAAAALVDGEAGDASGPVAVVEHDPARATIPRSSETALDVGSRRLLGGCGWRRPTEPADHEAAGGFVDIDTDATLDAAGTLRGRGWGDWCQDVPLGESAERARAAVEDTAVVVNAHGTAADRLLLESVPFDPLEGADLLAGAVDANRVVVYASEADEAAVERARVAVERYPDPAASMEVVTGPAVYRAAEPTMALEAIEGNHRLEARLRRPDSLPLLDGAPALVHTARTLAQLAVGLRTDRHGGAGEGDADAGTGGRTTRLVTVTGDVESAATVELSATATLTDALSAVTLSGEFKAAAVGGRFGGLTSSLSLSPAPEELAEADLGTEGVVEVLSADRCIVEFVGRRAALAADTNCGRCVPCREGATQLAELLRDVYDGDYDASGIAELCRVMDGSSVCAFGVEAARPARSAMATFDAEFRAHADGRCPAGACPEPAEVTQ